MTLSREEIERDRAAGTPGPWTASFDEATRIRDASGGAIATISYLTRWMRRRPNEAEANARRIARLPELEDYCLTVAARIAELEAALQRIADAPAWGAPDRWETTPAEIRQFARATLKGRDE